MLELSGFEVCCLVKDNPDLQFICVAVLATEGLAKGLAQEMAVGADCCMTKPFHPKEMLAKARQILQ